MLRLPRTKSRTTIGRPSVRSGASQPVMATENTAETLRHLGQLKEKIRSNLNRLVVSECDELIDAKVLKPLRELKDVSHHEAFWYAFFGAVVSELTAANDATFEVTASWLHYAVVNLVNEQQGQLQPVAAQKELLSFLMTALAMAEQLVAFKRNVDPEEMDAAERKSLLVKAPAQLAHGPPQLKVINRGWLLDDQAEGSSLKLTYRSETLVEFAIPSDAKKGRKLACEKGAIIGLTAALMRRNLTLATALAIALVEKYEDLVSLLEDGQAVNLLMENLQTVATAERRAGLRLEQVSAAVHSLVALFRAFYELKWTHGKEKKSQWKELPWVDAPRLTSLLDALIQRGGHDVWQSFAVRPLLPGPLLPGRRQLLLLQLLAEAVSQKLACTEQIFPRTSAFKVPEEGERELLHPPLSVGYFLYGTHDVAYQPYQWKEAFPLKPSPEGATHSYFAELLPLTRGSMLLGFYLEPSPYPGAAATASASHVFFNPTTGQLFLDGFELITNMSALKVAKESTAVIGVLLQTGLPPLSKDAQEWARLDSRVAQWKSSPSEPTVSLPGHRVAVTFFVNGAKLVVVTPEEKDDILAEPDEQAKEKFLEKFSEKLTAFQKKDIDGPCAFFTVGLAGYQAINLRRPFSSMNYLAKSKALHRLGDRDWKSFPVEGKHEDMERCAEVSLEGGLEAWSAKNKDRLKELFRSHSASYELTSDLKRVAQGGQFFVAYRAKKDTKKKDTEKKDMVVLKALQVLTTLDLQTIQREKAFYDQLAPKNKVRHFSPFSLFSLLISLSLSLRRSSPTSSAAWTSSHSAASSTVWSSSRC